MERRVPTLVGLLAVTLVGCRPDTVDLRYRFEPDQQLAYRMTADATATWEIGQDIGGGGSYRAVFDVVETVNAVDGSGADVSVVMTPTEIEDRGDLPPPGPEQRSFRLRVGPSGEVTEVLEVDGVPATALDPDELAFIGTYRPPLPIAPVRLHDRWRSEQEVELGETFQKLETTGQLESLDRAAIGNVAELGYSGGGPLQWRTMLPQGAAVLEGAAETSATASVAIDGGFLRGARSTTRGSFDVRVAPSDAGGPLAGRLDLTLELHLEKLES